VSARKYLLILSLVATLITPVLQGCTDAQHGARVISRPPSGTLDLIQNIANLCRSVPMPSLPSTAEWLTNFGPASAIGAVIENENLISVFMNAGVRETVRNSDRSSEHSNLPPHSDRLNQIHIRISRLPSQEPLASITLTIYSNLDRISLESARRIFRGYQLNQLATDFIHPNVTRQENPRGNTSLEFIGISGFSPVVRCRFQARFDATAQLAILSMQQERH
jgi:hypothetical protein